MSIFSAPLISVKNAALLLSSVSSVASVRSIFLSLKSLKARDKSSEFLTEYPNSLLKLEFSSANFEYKFFSAVPPFDPDNWAFAKIAKSAVVLSILIFATFAIGATSFIDSANFSVSKAEELNDLAIILVTLSV